jgi:hypothetical protein
VEFLFFSEFPDQEYVFSFAPTGQGVKNKNATDILPKID